MVGVLDLGVGSSARASALDRSLRLCVFATKKIWHPHGCQTHPRGCQTNSRSARTELLLLLRVGFRVGLVGLLVCLGRVRARLVGLCIRLVGLRVGLVGLLDVGGFASRVGLRFGLLGFHFCLLGFRLGLV